MQRHIDKKHRSFVCNVCNQIYKSKFNAVEHLRAHLQTFVCQYCGHMFNQLKHFQKHIHFKHKLLNKSTVQQKYDCRHCVRNFPTAAHRNGHENIVHKGRADPAFKCGSCSSNFITKEQLRLHSFEHFTGSLHYCTQPKCDRFFTSLRHLRCHLKIHNPPRYKCDVS